MGQPVHRLPASPAPSGQRAWCRLHASRFFWAAARAWVCGLRGDRSGRESAIRQCRSGHFHTQNSCSLQTVNYGSDYSESNASKQCPQLLPGKSYACTGPSTSIGVHAKNKGTRQIIIQTVISSAPSSGNLKFRTSDQNQARQMAQLIYRI
jgi:hypothetical protein